MVPINVPYSTERRTKKSNLDLEFTAALLVISCSHLSDERNLMPGISGHYARALVQKKRKKKNNCSVKIVKHTKANSVLPFFSLAFHLLLAYILTSTVHHIINSTMRYYYLYLSYLLKAFT